MSLLFETIRIQDGIIQNLGYHEKRANQSRAKLLGSTNLLSFSQVLHPSDYFKKGLVKARISFSNTIEDVTYNFYQPRKIVSLKKTHHDQIAYSHKFENRQALKALYDLRQGHSEVLIIKEGELTDCFYYNVALFDGSWWTPKSFLLNGTMRQYLLDQGTIAEKQILEKDLAHFSKIALFNALNPFGQILLNMEKIY